MPNADQALILTRREEDVITISLNRAHQFNALSEALLQALIDYLAPLQEDTTLRCVVIEAQGRAFCAGHDLKEMRSKPDLTYYRELFTRCGQLMQLIRALPVPVIAKVQGIATAAGCQLVAACDLAISADTAKFAVSGINVGLFCSTPAVPLSRNVPTKQAFEMLFTGRFIDAHSAQRWGLINDVVTPAELDARVQSLVNDIVAKSNAAVRYGKRMFYQQLEMPLAEAYAYASEVMAQNMMEDDVAEGIDAFIQKRAPVWSS
ncbi:enoyl-CoA hydratase [Oligella urethralis]|uniref:enoyl-CoA hydratase n=1 Tax=Oligella urethralis TaxID=90245 RepID=UPI00288B3D36|nr:enoyl-CoA hydratase [Oligella urethralis]